MVAIWRTAIPVLRAAGSIMRRRCLLSGIALLIALNGAAWPGPVAAQREDWPADCSQVMSSATIFIGHDCGEWASIMIVGRVEIKRPWSRTTRASRAVRIRERREGRSAGEARPDRPAPTAEAASAILALDVSGGSSPEPDCEDFASQAEAQAYFDANGWSAEVDPFQLDQGGIPGVPCEE